MIYTLNTHYKKDIDLTWAILLQMKDELTRADVLGIIETHKFNIIYTLNTHYKKDIDLTWAILLQMKDELTRADVLGIIETHKFNII